MGKKKIAVLGSTGSIGKQTLNIVREHFDQYQVVALTAHTNLELAAAQAVEFGAQFVGMVGLAREQLNKAVLPDHIQWDAGEAAMLHGIEATEPDMVVLSVVGAAGLPAFVYSLEHGIDVALANKEAMVCGGKYARKLMDRSSSHVLPVDSELSAIFQSLGSSYCLDYVKKIWLTASGGPFRTWEKQRIQNATRREALQHPNWSMGDKITVDSATLANKGLEIMETRWLFDIPADRIQVVVHPQSIVHSMVEYQDGCILAQLGPTNMELPIQYALSFPERLSSRIPPLGIQDLANLTFEEPDTEKFPCLALAMEAVDKEGGSQIVFNAANEKAVAFFLEDKITFAGIPRLIQHAMGHFDGRQADCLEEIFALDHEVRRYMEQIR